MNALTPSQDVDLDVLRAELVACAEDVALALLGEPNRKLSSKREWRWGTKGALCLELRGAKRGLWIDRSDDNRGGDLLGLIRREQGGGFPAGPN